MYYFLSWTVVRWIFIRLFYEQIIKGHNNITLILTTEKKDNSESKRRKSGSSKGCPFYKQDPIQVYKDSVLMEVCDIEQLVVLGKQMKACPYYGTRLAIPDAEVKAYTI